MAAGGSTVGKAVCPLRGLRPAHPGPLHRLLRAHRDFFLSHPGVTSFYGRMAAAADCATIRLPSAEWGMCPTKTQQARGPDWLEYGDGSPIRPYYSTCRARKPTD